jgi:hypothetical protein
MKIFVQITSYRDPELIPTIVECIRKAKNPNNLTFGICWQHDEKEDLKEFIINPKFRIIDVPWQESKGTGWAKSLVQNLYEGEDFTLQIDSHHRFEKDWDAELIKMLEGLNTEKAILSSFAGAYRASNGEKLNLEPYKISITNFDDNELPVLMPDYMPEWEKMNSPIKARFACSHFLFAKGSFCESYKYDPEIYFEGNDVSLSARCFTMGYSLFHPNKNLLWHEYTREGRRKHWLDHTQELKDKGQIELTWWERDEVSKKRVKQLLGIEDSQTSLGEFGLATNKTLREYEIYTGVDFSQKLIHPEVAKGAPPFEGTTNYEEWKKELTGSKVETEGLDEYSLEISWTKDEVEYANDYVFWFLGFHDEEGKEIYRKDLSSEDIFKFSKTNVDVTFKAKTVPVTCTIWPYSKSKGWLTKVETQL